MNKEERIS